MTIAEHQSRQPFPVERIQAELRHEWAAVCQHVEDETGQPPLRTNIMTLALMVRGEREARNARELLGQLATAVPSRVLLFILSPPGENLEARIWAHCAVERDSQLHNCYDVVEITIPQDELAAVPNILEENKLPDLPLFIVWNTPYNLMSNEFGRIARRADRLVIDTQHFNSALEALNDYARFLRTIGARCAGTDLCWSRLLTWRELIAQAFDGPQVCQLLPYVQQIDISFDPSVECEALLLAGWFTSRLKWTPSNASRHGETMSLTARASNGRAVQITLDRVARSGIGLRAVRVFANSGSQATRATIRRQGTGDSRSSVTLETTGMPRQRKIVQHLEPTRHELLGSELMNFYHDRTFEEALSHASEFARLILGLEQTT